MQNGEGASEGCIECEARAIPRLPLVRLKPTFTRRLSRAHLTKEAAPQSSGVGDSTYVEACEAREGVSDLRLATP
jgi:hypothetical protein